MIKIFLLLFILTTVAFAQTFPTLKVGDKAPIDVSAALEVKSTTGALLLPRMTTTQKNAILATNGDMVFDTTLGQYGVWTGGTLGSWTTLSTPAGGAVWGSITGTLSNQTDLQTALNLLAPIASPTFTGTATAQQFSGPLNGQATGNASYVANNHGVIVSGSTTLMTVVAPNASTVFPLVSGGASANPAWGLLSVAGGGTGQSTASTAFNALSPMTTLGDMISGSTSGAGARVGIGSSGSLLTVRNGIPLWGGGPMSATGDLIYGNDASGSPQRLGIGSSNSVLTVSSGLPSWKGGGLTNPMTTLGDMITGGASGTAGRLGIGSGYSILVSSTVTGAPQWGLRAIFARWGGGTPFSVGSVCTSSPCTIWSQSPGNLITSITRNSLGNYNINFVSGTFISMPVCMGWVYATSGTNYPYWSGQGASPSTFNNPNLYNFETGVLTVNDDGNGELMCFGF